MLVDTLEDARQYVTIIVLTTGIQGGIQHHQPYKQCYIPSCPFMYVCNKIHLIVIKYVTLLLFNQKQLAISYIPHLEHNHLTSRIDPRVPTNKTPRMNPTTRCPHLPNKLHSKDRQPPNPLGIRHSTLLNTTHTNIQIRSTQPHQIPSSQHGPPST